MLTKTGGRLLPARTGTRTRGCRHQRRLCWLPSKSLFFSFLRPFKSFFFLRPRIQATTTHTLIFFPNKKQKKWKTKNWHYDTGSLLKAHTPPPPLEVMGLFWHCNRSLLTNNKLYDTGSLLKAHTPPPPLEVCVYIRMCVCVWESIDNKIDDWRSVSTTRERERENCFQSLRSFHFAL